MYILNSNTIYNHSQIDFSLAKIKLEDIKTKLKKDFPEIFEESNYIVLKRGINVYIISQNQIMHTFQGDFTDLKVEESNQVVKKIMEILDVNTQQDIGGMIRLELLKNVEFDVMQRSKNFLKDLPETVLGAGVRLIIKKDDYFGDLKIEPYLKNNEQFYISIELDTVNNNSIEVSGGIIKNIITDMSSLGLKLIEEQF